MVRVSSAVARKKKHNRVLKKTKGQFGKRKKHYSQAKKSLIKGMQYSYRDRKVKKREFKSLWIVRINAACQEEGITYSRFINGLTKANVEIDRKMMSELAVSSTTAFRKLVKIAKESVGAKKASTTKKAEKVEKKEKTGKAQKKEKA